MENKKATKRSSRKTEVPVSLNIEPVKTEEKKNTKSDLKTESKPAVSTRSRKGKERKLPVYLTDFDIKKLIIEPPKTKIFDKASVTKSTVRYLDSGELCIPYIEGTKQFASIWEQNEMKKPGDDENKVTPLIGYTMRYPIRREAKTATEREELFKRAMDQIFEKARDTIVEFSEQYTEDSDGNKVSLLPDSAKAPVELYAMKSAKDPNVPCTFLKPLYSYGFKKGSKVLNTDYPPNMNVKLLCFGADKDLKVSTQLWEKSDEGVVSDETTHPGELVGGQIKIKPWFKLDSVYYGGHGQTSYTASVQIKLDQGEFKYASQGKTERFLSRKKREKDADIDEDIKSAGKKNNGGDIVKF